jgi:hypothetical protein
MSESLPFKKLVTETNKKDRDPRRIAIGAGLALGAAVTAGAVMLANQGSEHSPEKSDKTAVMNHLTNRQIGDKLKVVDGVIVTDDKTSIQTAPWKGADALKLVGPASIDRPEIVSNDGSTYLCFEAGGSAANVGCIELNDQNKASVTFAANVPGTARGAGSRLSDIEMPVHEYTVDNVDQGLAFTGGTEHKALAQIETTDIVLQEKPMDIVLPEQTPTS